MIELLASSGNDNTIANVARVSMQHNTNWDALPENYSDSMRDSLIKYLAKNKHTSPFRHTSITVRCEVPIFLARQLGKHQVGMSWNEVSRRYVKTDFTFFEMTDKWRSAADNVKQGSGGLISMDKQAIANDLYDNVIDVCEGAYYHLLLEGVAPEQARMVLPQSMMTQFIWTGSLMAFAHVYKLRVDSHAQVEAQEFAKELDEVISPIFPIAWKALTSD